MSLQKKIQSTIEQYITRLFRDSQEGVQKGLLQRSTELYRLYELKSSGVQAAQHELLLGSCITIAANERSESFDLKQLTKLLHCTNNDLNKFCNRVEKLLDIKANDIKLEELQSKYGLVMFGKVFKEFDQIMSVYDGKARKDVFVLAGFYGVCKALKTNVSQEKLMTPYRIDKKIFSAALNELNANTEWKAFIERTSNSLRDTRGKRKRGTAASPLALDAENQSNNNDHGAEKNEIAFFDDSLLFHKIMVPRRTITERPEYKRWLQSRQNFIDNDLLQEPSDQEEKLIELMRNNPDTPISRLMKKL
jgi:hypothetical protein